MTSSSSLEDDGVAIAVFVLRDRELARLQTTALNRKTASQLADFDVCGLAAAVGVEGRRLVCDADVGPVLAQVRDCLAAGRPMPVDVAIAYSEKTFFTAAVVKTNLLRFSWPDQLRLIGRALKRKVL